MSNLIGYAADLAQNLYKLIQIIRAAAAGGWVGAAVAALKAYWPKILPVAIAIILLPSIVVMGLPAILFGSGDINEEALAARISGYYNKYEDIRREQLEVVKNQQGVAVTIEYLNDPFDISWLTAIHSVSVNNELSLMSLENVKEVIAKTYSYVIVDAPEDESNPWDDTTHRPSDPDGSSSGIEKIIEVTTLTPEEAMNALKFDEAKREWATSIYEGMNA